MERREPVSRRGGMFLSCHLQSRIRVSEIEGFAILFLSCNRRSITGVGERSTGTVGIRAD